MVMGESTPDGHGGVLDGEVVLRKLGDLARVWSTANLALWGADEVARIRLQCEVSPEEVLAQTPHRPNDPMTLELAWIAVTPLDRSRCARQGACGVEFTGIVMLQQRGTEAARGGVGAKYELANRNAAVRGTAPRRARHEGRHKHCDPLSADTPRAIVT